MKWDCNRCQTLIIYHISDTKLFLHALFHPKKSDKEEAEQRFVSPLLLTILMVTNRLKKSQNYFEMKIETRTKRGVTYNTSTKDFSL